MRARRLALCLAVALSGGTSLRAGGEDGFLFLERPLGARGAAMGGALVAVADDASAAAWNPAAWSQVRRNEVFLASARGAEDASLSGLSVGRPFGAGAVGVEVRSADDGEIPGYDSGGLRNGSVSSRARHFSLGYGRPLRKGFAAGASIGEAGQQVAGVSGRSFAASAGLLWRPALPGRWRGLHLGAAARHLGPGATFLKEKTSLPRVLSAGAAYSTFSEAWTTAVAVEKAGQGPALWRAGQEVWLGDRLALRAGYARRAGFLDGTALGAGFRMRELQIDYAFEMAGRGYEDGHRVSLTWRFGGPTEALYQEGVRLLRAARHGEAVLKFNEVLDLEPGHRKAVERLREAADLLRREKRGGDDEAR